MSESLFYIIKIMPSEGMLYLIRSLHAPYLLGVRPFQEFKVTQTQCVECLA